MVAVCGESGGPLGTSAGAAGAVAEALSFAASPEFGLEGQIGQRSYSLALKARMLSPQGAREIYQSQKQSTDQEMVPKQSKMHFHIWSKTINIWYRPLRN